MPVPAIPTEEFQYPFRPIIDPYSSSAANIESWQKGEWLARISFPEVQRWRTHELNLPATTWDAYLRKIRSTPHLFGYSAKVLPKPKDWGELQYVTGYWFPNEEQAYAPARELEDFLAAGPPPIVFGFSSQASRQNAELTRVFVNALKHVGLRGLFLTGWGGLTDVASDGVHAVSYVPHRWLLKRAAGMVHHGGAGTVGECLFAALPSVAVPFGYDGHFWGWRLATLGAGLPPVTADQIEFRGACRLITDLADDSGIRMRAAQIGSALQDEDGVDNAVRVIESFMKQRGVTTQTR